jgi:WD40 repeat protein
MITKTRPTLRVKTSSDSQQSPSKKSKSANNSNPKPSPDILELLSAVPDGASLFARQRFRSVARLSSAFASFDDGKLQTRPVYSSRIHSRCITAAKISPGSNPIVATAGLDCKLIFSCYSTGEAIREIDTENSFVFDISIVQYDNRIIIATASQDGKIRIYDASNDFSLIQTLEQSSTGVCLIVWSVFLFNSSCNTPYCVSGGATKVIHVFDWLTGVELLSLHGHKEGIRCLAVSEDGIISSGSNDQSVKLWSLATKKFIQTFRGHTAEVNALAFVPHTPFLISACENNVLRQWNYKSGERVKVFPPYNGNSVLSLSVIPSRRDPYVLVAGTVSSTAPSPLVAIQVYELSTGNMVCECTGTRYQITAVSARYDPRGDVVIIVAGGLDSTLRSWQLSSELLPNLDNADDLFERSLP